MSLMERIAFKSILLFVVLSMVSCAHDHGKSKISCRIDLAILVDQSGSIFDNGGVEAWYKMTNFTMSIINTFVSETVNSHVALVRFGHRDKNYTNGLIANKEDMINAVNAMKIFIRGERTNTSAALYLANKYFDQKGNARGGDRPDVPDVVILVTDGKQNNGLNGRIDNSVENKAYLKTEILNLASDMKNRGVQIITVGVTDKTDPEFLAKVATAPVNYIAVMDFSTLAQELNDVISKTCRAVSPPPPCLHHSDVNFVLDFTEHLDESEFKDIRKFISNMMLRIPLSHGSQAGIVYLPENEILGFNVGEYYSPEENVEAAMKIQYRKRTKGMTETLKYLRQYGYFGLEEEPQKFAVIITDGNSSTNIQETLNEAYRVKKQGIHIIVIGVSKWHDVNLLEQIASYPYTENYMHYSKTSTLLLNETEADIKLKKLICNDVNECNSTTCQCGGTCVDKIGSFTCLCPGNCAGVLCERNCKHRTDVVFAVESSNGMDKYDFRTALNFVQNMTMRLNIHSGDRVGLIRISTNPYIVFQLKDHKTVDELLNAFAVAYIEGDVNMISAISKVRNQMFNANNGDANDRHNVLVILTSKKSNSYSNTWNEARFARQSGITIIAVGITSNANDKELQVMASGLGSTNVFKADKFSDLPAILYKVADAICNNVDECENQPCLNGGTPVDHIGYCTCNCVPPSGAVGGYSGIQCERSGTGKVDIVLLIDSSGSVKSTSRTQLLNLLAEFITNYPVGNQLAKIGVVYFSDTQMKAFGLTTYILQEDIISHIMDTPFIGKGTNLAEAIKFARISGFKESGDRADARNILVIVTDGESNVDNERIIREAAAFKQSGSHTGASIVVLGVGRYINTLELRGMASQPHNKMCMMPSSFHSNISNVKFRTELLNNLILSSSDGINHCKYNPCKNGGKCHNDLHKYVCECPNGKTGRDCSRDCDIQIDLALVLDFSGTRESVYTNVIKMSREIIYGLPGPNKVQIAVVEYDDTARVHFTLTNHTTSKQEIIDDLPFGDRELGSNTAAALQLLVTEIFTRVSGDRRDMRNVGVVITDGGSTIANTKAAASFVVGNGIELFAVGFGQVKVEELNSIASYPADTHKIMIDSSTDVQQAANQLLKYICQIK